MKIAVLIKQTPDTAELPKVSAAEVTSGEIKITQIINPWDEFGAEEAIRLADRLNGESVAISLGTPGNLDALKHALAMGVTHAVLVDQSDTGALDNWGTAAALAGAVTEVGEVDLVIAGRQSVDGNSGVVYVGVAAKLGWELVSNVIEVMDLSTSQITVRRSFEGGVETVTSPLPAVISVAKEINDPRYPSFMGIRKASRAKIPTVMASALGATPERLISWGNVRKPEERKSTVQIIDGASVAEKASKLVDALLAEKVI